MRYILFAVAIAVGLGLGLLYGWVLSPVELIETSPSTLRMDYQADYVLMVAEAYVVEEDISLAVRRLALLGDQHPVEIINQAGVFARDLGYIQDDLTLMSDLAEVLRTWNPALEPVLTPTTP